MAMLLTLFQTLALHGVDDRGYLRAYLERQQLARDRRASLYRVVATQT